jgi:putative DNA primase/helicase
VFPLRAKVPAISKQDGGNGYKDASRDRSRVTALFNRAGRDVTGYGIATGAASERAVIDVDGPKGRAEAEQLGLRSGYVVKSGRVEGDGWHLYYSIPAGVTIKSRTLAPNVELKAEGAYVVGAGSLHPSGVAYRVVKDGEPSPLPDWLMQPERKPGRSAADAPHGEARGTVSIDVAGPPINAGERNQTLARIAGRLHDGTRDLEQLTRDLLAINDARCSPPLEEREVRKIAASIFARTPCTPGPGHKATPEVLAALDGVQAHALAAFGWARTSEHTDPDVLLAVCRFARRHGTMIPSGVRVEVSVRELAEEAAIGSTRTVWKAINRLRQAGCLRRDGGGRNGPKRGALVILRTRAKGNTQPPFRYRATDRSSVSPCAHPRSAPRLRWSAPGHGGRLGKRRGRVVDVLEGAGGAGLDLETLADALAGEDGKRPRTRDLRRRTLPPLLSAGVAECAAGKYRLSADWRKNLDRRRAEDGEVEAARLQRVYHREKQQAFREAWARGEVVSRPEFARRRVERDRIRPEERHVSGSVSDLQHAPEPAPQLLEALRKYLALNPRQHPDAHSPEDRRMQASWLASTLRVYGLVEGNPTPEDVAHALAELPEGVAA